MVTIVHDGDEFVSHVGSHETESTWSTNGNCMLGAPLAVYVLPPALELTAPTVREGRKLALRPPAMADKFVMEEEFEGVMDGSDLANALRAQGVEVHFPNRALAGGAYALGDEDGGIEGAEVDAEVKGEGKRRAGLLSQAKAQKERMENESKNTNYMPKHRYYAGGARPLGGETLGATDDHRERRRVRFLNGPPEIIDDAEGSGSSSSKGKHGGGRGSGNGGASSEDAEPLSPGAKDTIREQRHLRFRKLVMEESKVVVTRTFDGDATPTDASAADTEADAIAMLSADPLGRGYTLNIKRITTQRVKYVTQMAEGDKELPKLSSDGVAAATAALGSGDAGATLLGDPEQVRKMRSKRTNHMATTKKRHDTGEGETDLKAMEDKPLGGSGGGKTMTDEEREMLEILKSLSSSSSPSPQQQASEPDQAPSGSGEPGSTSAAEAKPERKGDAMRAARAAFFKRKLAAKKKK